MQIIQLNNGSKSALVICNELSTGDGSAQVVCKALLRVAAPILNRPRRDSGRTERNICQVANCDAIYENCGNAVRKIMIWHGVDLTRSKNRNVEHVKSRWLLVGPEQMCHDKVQKRTFELNC